MRKESSTNTENRTALGECCIANELLTRLALRWNVPVLFAIANGKTSYAELRRALPAITDQMLATRLRELLAEALVVRTDAGYAPTVAGQDLLGIVGALCDWSERNQVTVNV